MEYYGANNSISVWSIILGSNVEVFPTILLFIILLIFLYLSFIKKVSNEIQATFFCLTATPCLNCLFVTLRLFVAIPIIIVFSCLMWLGYSNEITHARIFKLKGIATNDKREAMLEEKSYDKMHSKSEILQIKQAAKKADRIRLYQFLLLSLISPLIYLLVLIIMGYKYQI